MTRFDFSPTFRTMLDFALLLGLTDGVVIAAMAINTQDHRKAGALSINSCRRQAQVENFMFREISEAAEARTHSEPEIRRIWWAVHSRCKAIARQGAGIDQFREDSRLSELLREARIEAL